MLGACTSVGEKKEAASGGQGPGSAYGTTVENPNLHTGNNEEQWFIFFK